MTIGTGDTFLTKDVDRLSISSESTSCKLVGSGGTISGKCLKVTSTTLPNHEAGPFCSGGFWDGMKVDFPSSSIVSCLCQRFHCDTTCNDVCLECAPSKQSRTYLIPLDPVVETVGDELVAMDGADFGDGLALNGVPLAKSDPFDELMGQNNIAPLDPYGGHSTLQLTYHYHAIPTAFFTCQSGWDATHQVWATAAPDGNHSPLIGWALDGLPVYG